MGETGFGLKGSGEFIILGNTDSEIMDSLAYDDSPPWPVEADGQGATLELIDPERDNAVAENWTASQEHGTPGKVNSCVTSVEETDNQILPDEFSLFQNYPNPFNPETTIKYSVPRNGHITLIVYDLSGREVAKLVDGIRQPGIYTVSFDGSGLASGIYFYQLKTAQFTVTKKCLLCK